MTFFDLKLVFFLAILVGYWQVYPTAIYLAWGAAVKSFQEDAKSSLSFQQIPPIRKYLVIISFVLLIAISCVSYFISNKLLFVEGKEYRYKKEGNTLYLLFTGKSGVFSKDFGRSLEVIAVGNGSVFWFNHSPGTY